MSDLKSIIEALIYASPEPVTMKALGKLLESEPKEDVEAAVVALKQDYDRPGGLQLVEVAGGYQIVTKPEYHEWVRRLFHERTTQKLSVAALETLAVIAYRQPVTVPEIGDIRGVNASGVIGTLVDRKLIKIVGRKTSFITARFSSASANHDLPKVETCRLLGFDLPAKSAPTHRRRRRRGGCCGR
jgi:segregation and condensation protein B